jgi:hypothetical protein
MTNGNKIWVQMKHKYHSTHIKQNKCKKQNIFKPHNEKYEKVLNLGGFWPPTTGEMTRSGPFSMGGETLTSQRCIPNMKTIPSKLWSVASGNQTVSGGDGGGGRDQNQSIPDFVRAYNYGLSIYISLTVKLKTRYQILLF